MPPLVAMLPAVAASVLMTAAAESRGATPTAVAVPVESLDLASLSVLHPATTTAATASVVRRRNVELMRSPVRGEARARARGDDRCRRGRAIRAAPSRPGPAAAWHRAGPSR